MGSVKIGTIGDWDISGLEDETLVTGGTDGSVSCHEVTFAHTLSQLTAADYGIPTAGIAI